MSEQFGRPPVHPDVLKQASIFDGYTTAGSRARIKLSISKGVPSQLCLVAGGKLETTQGPLILDEVGAQKLEAQVADYTVSHLVIDYGHETEKKGGGGAIAAGWFRPEIRRLEGGVVELWAVDIKWTGWARVRIEEKEFLFFSPVFSIEPFEGGERIVGVWSIALTNIPASKRQSPLVALERTEMPPEILALLPEGAQYIGEFKPGVVLYAIGEKLYSQKINGGALEGVAIEWKPQGAEMDLTAQLSRQPELIQLHRELAQMKAERAASDVRAVLDRGIAAGAILPSEREALTALALSGDVGRKELDRRANGPRLVPSKPGEKAPAGGAVTKEQFDRMSHGERAVLSKQDPQLYRQLRLGKG